MSYEIFSDNAKKVLEARYLKENETWEKFCFERVGKNLAQRESNQSYWTEKFGSILFNREFIYGGRILRNIGRLKGNLLNCFNIPLADNINAIGEFIKNALIVWKHGGGIGTFADLRPKGHELKTTEGTSSGLVSFFRAFDAVAATIESGGQRRAAGLGLISISHPDLFEFLDAKLQNEKADMEVELKDSIMIILDIINEYKNSSKMDKQKLEKVNKAWKYILSKLTNRISHFNLSVAINNEFLEAVERNNGWELQYNKVVYKEIPAREIWTEIITRMVTAGEPSLINWSNFIKNNSYYFAPVTGCNACAEIPMENFSSCLLGSICLPRFVTNKNTNWKHLEEVLRIAVRALDNVIDITYYPLSQIEETTKNSRRIGLGIMGLSDYFFLKEIRYGSPKSVNEVEKVWRFVRDTVYDESCKLALEKGVFPKFDSVSYGKASFVRKLPQSLRHSIKKHGIRNCTLLSGQPTGCLIPSTKIRTNLGIKTINEIFKLNNINLETKRKSKNVWFVPCHEIFADTLEGKKRIVKCYINGLDKVISLKSNSKELITGTLNHKVLVVCKNNPQFATWKRLDEIEVGDKIFIDYEKFETIEVDSIELKEQFTVDLEIEDTHHYILENGVVSHNTTSLIADVNSGIESLFAKAYIRKDNISERYYIHPIYAKYLKKEINELPSWFVDAHDISPSEHLDVLVAALKYVDSNISKTINLPKGTKVEEVKDLLLEYIWDLKGVTIYVDQSRSEQVLYPLSEEQAKKHIDTAEKVQDFQCLKSGSCEL